jgi:uncharacterized membrane protein YozB (DUF420 family)
MTAETLPTLNAILNGIATLLLICGLVLVQRGRHRAHGYVMAGAVVVSAVFLVSYLTHKAIYPNISIASRFPNLPEIWKHIYWWVILVPHLILAVAMLPFVYLALIRAYRKQFERHKAVTRYLIWVWLYVSVTGVVIYGLLYHYFPLLNARV